METKTYKLTGDLVAVEEYQNIPIDNGNLRCTVNCPANAFQFHNWCNLNLCTDLAAQLIQPDGGGTGVDGKQIASDYQWIRRAATQTNPRLVIGRYISGRHVRTNTLAYPAECASNKTFAASELESVNVQGHPAWRVRIDQSAARTKFVTAILTAHNRAPAPILFVDEIVHPASLPGESWENQMDLLARVKAGLTSGTKLYANIALVAYAMAGNESQLLMDAVDGICLEMPYHTDARTDVAKTQLLFGVYREWLDAGKTVILHPSDVDQTEEGLRWMAQVAMMLRNPADRLFVAAPFWYGHTPWTRYPALFGSPFSDCIATSGPDGVILSRRFEKGQLRINASTKAVLEMAYPPTGQTANTGL
jgi:hypothetical protein